MLKSLSTSLIARGTGELQEAQELTLPQQPKGPYPGAAFPVEVAQGRCALNGRYPRVSDGGGFRSGGCLLVACTYLLLR
jgi:hypothetical protein